MFLFERTAQINGTIDDAGVDWAKDLTRYLNHNYPEHKTALYTTFQGDRVTLHWISEFDTVATFNATLERLKADTEYLRRLELIQANPAWIRGTMQDKLLRRVELD